MRYLPTIDIWNRGIHTAIVSGQLKLQSGQWIQCGTGAPSRFISVSDIGVINAVHWSGDGKTTRNKYLQRARLHRLDLARQAGTITTKECWLAAKEVIECKTFTHCIT